MEKHSDKFFTILKIYRNRYNWYHRKQENCE